MATKRSIPLKIYLTPNEHELVQQQADGAELSLSRYGRLTLLSPFAQDLRDSQNLQDSYKALSLHLAQHYLLLSVLASDLKASDLKAFSTPGSIMADSNLQDLLRAVQEQVKETFQAVEVLLHQLRRLEERQ